MTEDLFYIPIYRRDLLTDKLGALEDLSPKNHSQLKGQYYIMLTAVGMNGTADIKETSLKRIFKKFGIDWRSFKKIQEAIPELITKTETGYFFADIEEVIHKADKRKQNGSKGGKKRAENAAMARKANSSFDEMTEQYYNN
jgi:ribosomal protein L12E/L44/L45/RPP1/RPP2